MKLHEFKMLHTDEQEETWQNGVLPGLRETAIIT